MMTQEVAFQCLDSWGRAVAKKDKSGVLNRYIDSATLWPTLSNELRQGPDRISITLIISSQNQWGCRMESMLFPVHIELQCVWSGIYSFNLVGGITVHGLPMF